MAQDRCAQLRPAIAERRVLVQRVPRRAVVKAFGGWRRTYAGGSLTAILCAASSAGQITLSSS